MRRGVFKQIAICAVFFLGATVFFLSALGAITYFVKRLGAVNHLLATGEPVPAIVTKLKPILVKFATLSSGGYEYRIAVRAFEFLDRQGNTVQGQTRSDATNYVEAALGSVVTVVFDPDNPRRNTLYPVNGYKIEK